MHKTLSSIDMPTLLDHQQRSLIVTSVKIVEPSLCSSSYSFLDVLYYPLTNSSRPLSMSQINLTMQGQLPQLNVFESQVL